MVENSLNNNSYNDNVSLILDSIFFDHISRSYGMVGLTRLLCQDHPSDKTSCVEPWIPLV